MTVYVSNCESSFYHLKAFSSLLPPKSNSNLVLLKPNERETKSLKRQLSCISHVKYPILLSEVLTYYLPKSSNKSLSNFYPALPHLRLLVLTVCNELLLKNCILPEELVIRKSTGEETALSQKSPSGSIKHLTA